MAEIEDEMIKNPAGYDVNRKSSQVIQMLHGILI